MGLFDSIRRVVGGGAATASDDVTMQPALVDTHDLDVSALRERASGVAGEVELLDFSLDSLAQFDDAIDSGYDEDLATADVSGTYATDTVRFGCYLGEVLVRAHGGEWTHNPDWGVTISGPDGTTTVAVFDVAERSITTGAVFAAVADRAAGEVGLDGVPADSEPSGGDLTGGDETGTTADDPWAETASGDDPPAEEPDDSSPAAEPSSGGGPKAADPEPDPSADDPTSAEADRGPVDPTVDDTASLIEEAEPATAAGDTVTTAESESPDEPTTATDSPATPEPSESLSEGGTDQTGRDGSPSLFDDSAAGSGSTMDDPPGVADGTDSDDTPSEDTDPAAGDGLRATYAETAEELASFWTEYDLDYTPASLEPLDALVSEEWDDDRFDDAEFGSDNTFDDRAFTSVATELGSYFGEVLVRALDAEWSDETATDAVVVEAADGPLAIPVFKVAGTAIKQQSVFARSYDSLLSDLESDA